MPFSPQFQLESSVPGFNAIYQLHRQMDEDRAKENRQLAREFKANQEIAEIAFGLPKDESLAMGADSLRGFVRGNMAKRELDEMKQRADFQALADYGRAQDLANESQSFEALKRFTGNYAQQIHPQLSPQLADFYESPEQHKDRPAIDPIAALADALPGNEAATAHPNFENFLRHVRSTQPEEVIDVDGNKFLRNTATGGMHPIPKPAPSGKTPAVPITDEEGNVLGYGIQNSRGGLTQLRQPPAATAKRHPLQTRLDSLEAKLEAARADLARKHEVDGLAAEAGALRRKIASEGKANSTAEPATALKYDPATRTFK